jgi:hypothetical protein
MRTLRVAPSFEVGKDPDVFAYDASLHLLHVAGEACVVSLFRVGEGAVSKLGDGHVGPNAHVVAGRGRDTPLLLSTQKLWRADDAAHLTAEALESPRGGCGPDNLTPTTWASARSCQSGQTVAAPR